MGARFVNVDRDSPMLLPPDLRDWVARDDLARFVLDAVEQCDLQVAHLNVRGSGDAQYPPGMMLALLIFCYAHGLFSSRRIEQATYHHVSVRYLCANLHPDHDTIAAFRRHNAELLTNCFVRVLELAQELKAFRQMGQISVDGTKLKARASLHANRTSTELAEQSATLQQEIEGLLAEAERADQTPAAGDNSLAAKLQDKQARRAALQVAAAALDQRQRQHEQERAAARHARVSDTPLDPQEPSAPSCPPRANSAAPEEPAKAVAKKAAGTINLVEPESRLMRDAHGAYLQGYNAQIAVDTSGSQLIVGAQVIQDANDRRALPEVMRAIPEKLRKEVKHLVLDTGFDNAGLNAQIEAEYGVTILCPPQSPGPQKRGETYRVSKALKRRQDYAEEMRKRLEQPENKERYRRRAATVEPVFGVLKNVLGFTRFRLFGLAKVQIEFTLVAIAYNLRRLSQWSAAQSC